MSLSGISASEMRLSSVTAATMTTVGLLSLPLSSLATRERETGGRLILDCNFCGRCQFLRTLFSFITLSLG